jgi:hypothetical protein
MDIDRLRQLAGSSNKINESYQEYNVNELDGMTVSELIQMLEKLNPAAIVNFDINQESHISMPTCTISFA